MTQPPPDIGAINKVATRQHLDVLGVLATQNGDPVAETTKTIVLLGPREPGFWHHFTAQPEYHDNAPDPLDRWSDRVISAMAASLDGVAVFPFGSAPHAPFIDWALRSGRAWTSPVGLLVHDMAGLFLSFRGAICLPYAMAQSHVRPCPCDSCDAKPCLTACPAGALSGDGYDLNACHGYLDTDTRHDCLNGGCAARRACPVSQSYGRLPDQSAHHMAAFHSCA